jgi:hypothetical protein
VKVEVQIERRPEALNRGHGAAAPTPDAAPSGSLALEAEEGTDEDGEHGAAELVVPGEHVAKAVREGEDPLPDGKTAKRPIGQMSGEFGHPPAAARGAETTALARKRDQDLMPAAVTPKAGKAPRQNTTRKKCRSSRSMNIGRPSPSLRALASARNVSRFSRRTRCSTPSSGRRGT